MKHRVGRSAPLPDRRVLTWLLAMLLPVTLMPAVAAEMAPRESLEVLRASFAEQRVVGDMVRFDGMSLAGFVVDTAADAKSRIRALDDDADESAAAAEAGSRESLLARFPASGLLHNEAFYGFETCTSRSIAGRSGRCVRITPKDEHRPGYTLWMDRSMGVLLGVIVHDPDGKPLEFLQYTRIRVEPRTSAFAPEPVGVIASADDAGSPPRWLPPGFVVAARERTADGRVTHFSDGVTGFSVFVVPCDDPSTQTGESLRGASVVVDRVVRTADGRDHLITVAGEIPLPTARRVLLGIRPE